MTEMIEIPADEYKMLLSLKHAVQDFYQLYKKTPADANKIKDVWERMKKYSGSES